MPVYDHNIKAGNPGDTIKHPALIAALNALAENHTRERFNYTDLFAGYGINPIIHGNEWTEGIGRLQPLLSGTENTDLKLYRDWYLSRPTLYGGIYPGSALIAMDTLIHNGLQPELTLYDISDTALASLRQCFPNQLVVPRPALPEDIEIANTDFLFIDPPGLYSEQNPTFPSLRYLLEFERRIKNPAVMFWLPITGTGEPGGETELTRESVNQLSHAGYSINKIRWADHHRTVGCMIATKLPEPASIRLTESIQLTAKLSGWSFQILSCIHKC